MSCEALICRAFAQGVSDHESGTSTSTIVLTLPFYTCLSFQNSRVHFVFCNNSAVPSVFDTKFEPSPLFSAQILNSASTAAQATVSCLYSAHVRLPLRGASRPADRVLFASGGAVCFETVFGTHFFTQQSHI